jgi:hypothetical protein
LAQAALGGAGITSSITTDGAGGLTPSTSREVRLLVAEGDTEAALAVLKD